MKKRDLLTLDFESFFSDEYSLSKMTAIEYVYDDRFELILFSIKRNDEPTVWFTGTWEESIVFLAQHKIEECVVAGHNMSEFDCLILWKMGFVPYRYICTLQCARYVGTADVSGGSLAALCAHFGLPPKGNEVVMAKGKRRADFSPAELQAYGNYCVGDTDRSHDLLMIFFPQIPQVEWIIMDITTKMLARPLLVLDRPRLEAYIDTLANRQEEILSEVGVSREDLASNDKFANVLRGLGIDPPMKVSKTTGKAAFAFAKSDPDMQAMLESDDEYVSAIVAARINVKSTIEATRSQRFVDVARRMGGLIPIPQRYGGTVTMRPTGIMKMNVLNLSARRREPVLKKSLVAPDGYVVIAGDSGQIEARMGAYHAGQDDLVQAFREGRDVYREFASEGVYHCPLAEITQQQRQVGKTGILSLGYMTGAKRFREMVRVDAGILLDLDEAKSVVDGYRARYSHIKTAWDVCKVVLVGLINGDSFKFGRDEWIVSNGAEKSITLPSGRKYYFHNLRNITIKKDGQDQQAMVYDRKQGRANRMVFIHPGQLTAMLVSGMSRDLLLWQGAKIARRFPIVQQVYDEHVWIAPKEMAEEALEYGKECMLSAPSWLGSGLPLKVDIGSAATYGDC
jgi:hypothetical protein